MAMARNKDDKMKWVPKGELSLAIQVAKEFNERFKDKYSPFEHNYLRKDYIQYQLWLYRNTTEAKNGIH